MIQWRNHFPLSHTSLPDTKSGYSTGKLGISAPSKDPDSSRQIMIQSSSQEIEF